MRPHHTSQRWSGDNDLLIIGIVVTLSEIEALFTRQLQAWPAAAERINLLSTAVERKKVGPYLVQWNPARAVSTMAKVDKASLEKRPCFLCAQNRPKEQEGIHILKGRWEVLINPFPILERHLTIVSTTHQPQLLTLHDLEDMVRISEALPAYTLFYNGARCGASAPDHKHLQAGLAPKDIPLFALPDQSPSALWEQICSLPKEEGREEPDFNLLMQNGRGWLIPRTQHRPACYHDGTCMVSPGALDMAGLIITAREEDFCSITEECISEILDECGVPKVRVGILEAEEIHHKATTGGFTLENVVIGKNFHWQRLQSQTFQGELIIRQNPATGLKVAINTLSVEDYLLSVISSEMSGTSSLELLKAHAVISRSWVLRMKERAKNKQASESACMTSEGLKFYDSSAHTLYDVCADDHCQRYQGIGGVNPVVREAIAQTRGEVLVAPVRENADGKSCREICDTRFSKCCGGRTERFSSCWEDKDYDYLQPVECPYCDTKDKNLLRQVLNPYDLETSNFHDWQVRYSQEELSALVESKLNLCLGTIQSLEPLRRGASGRIISMRVTGTQGMAIVGKELEIRKALSPTYLYSSNFTVERDGSDFILTGHGWGHGVGLCQIGAAVMAHEGYDYRQILAHYYPGSQIADNYNR